MDVDIVRKMNDLKNEWSNEVWNKEIVPFIKKLADVGGPYSAGSVGLCAMEDVLARMMASQAQLIEDRQYFKEEYDQFFDVAHEALRDCVRNFMTQKIPGYKVVNVKLDDEAPKSL